MYYVFAYDASARRGKKLKWKMQITYLAILTTSSLAVKKLFIQRAKLAHVNIWKRAVENIIIQPERKWLSF